MASSDPETPGDRKPRAGRIPVTILTGFLGAGKTTLLNDVLRRVAGTDHRLAVIENEFGVECGIESGLVGAGAPGASPDGAPAGGAPPVPDVTEVCEFRELVGGCVCCSVRPSLILALAEIADKGVHTHVVIETTGLADPQPVANVLFATEEGLADKFELNSVVTVVDAAEIERQLAEPKPAGVENEAVAQLRLADLVVINKTDLVDAAGLERVRKAVARDAGGHGAVTVVATDHGRVDVEALLSGALSRFDEAAVLAQNPEFRTLTHHRHDESIVSVASIEPRPLDREAATQMLARLAETYADARPRAAADASSPPAPLGVIRMKAELLFADAPGVRHVMQGVAGRFAVTAQGAWRHGTSPASRLVVIGRGVDFDDISGRLSACVARPAGE